MTTEPASAIAAAAILPLSLVRRFPRTAARIDMADTLSDPRLGNR
jgi:hypothetical protein